MPLGANRSSLHSLTMKGSSTPNYVSSSKKVKANYILEALSQFLVMFNKERPTMAVGEWFLQWHNALVHAISVVRSGWRPRLIEHTPPPPFARPGTAGLFLVPEHQEAAGRQDTHPGEL
jgi:hypothetical protein